MIKNLDFRNANTLWSSIVAETLFNLGLKTAVICPGSRSTPLTIAFANHPNIETIPILDERSASFFALGIAKRSCLPVVLICTSGTAGANFYPAVIEAKESKTALLILTADRPPELRDCHAGQSIDQVKLYGSYCNWYTELSLPSIEMKLLSYLRQTIVSAWNKSFFPNKGVVHLNCPFREPLTPFTQPEIELFPSKTDFRGFFLDIYEHGKIYPSNHSKLDISNYLNKWKFIEKGIIIAGVNNSTNPSLYCENIAFISKFLNYPILAEALSPLRNFASKTSNLINTYDTILYNQKLSKYLKPDIVIQFGQFPTSKRLREWLEKVKAQCWLIDSSSDNFDPLHNHSFSICSSVENLDLRNVTPTKLSSDYLTKWKTINDNVNQNIESIFIKIDSILQAKLPFILSKILPHQTNIFIANSMSVRYAEFFWLPNNKELIPYFNRGANGIDGTLSSALGMAQNSSKNILVTGDLALLHDTNGFLISKKFKGHLTIILVNNSGGGIFEMLPISKDKSLFEDYFVTPQSIDFAKLCNTYDIQHTSIKDWQHLKQLLNPLPSSGIRVLELKIKRKEDASWLKNNLDKFTY
ncbi:MAG: 2-succinyl-5-enolpyruvyl-6-hydroxy-3-cyclohexene-1-carboxylic-acid synthase [Candidatus Atelocyanobacterium thalassa]